MRDAETRRRMSYYHNVDVCGVMSSFGTVGDYGDVFVDYMRWYMVQLLAELDDNSMLDVFAECEDLLRA